MEYDLHHFIFPRDSILSVFSFGIQPAEEGLLLVDPSEVDHVPESFQELHVPHGAVRIAEDLGLLVGLAGPDVDDPDLVRLVRGDAVEDVEGSFHHRGLGERQGLACISPKVSSIIELKEKEARRQSRSRIIFLLR